jgi:anti-sigma factor RsiW
MKIMRPTELMHVVLDGEATSEETRELERTLAADPAARAEFDELKHLFDDLGRVPKVYPPEGLVSSVMASLSQQERSEDGIRQPFTARRVIGSAFRDAPGSGPGRSVRDSGGSQQWPNFRSNEMREQKGGSKRKIWIGGAIAAAAVVLVMSSGIDFPPGTKDTSGTIVPVTRYKAPQNTAEDVKLGAPGAAESSTIPTTVDAATQGASQAAGRTASQVAGQTAGRVAGQTAGRVAGQTASQVAGQTAAAQGAALNAR